jgi:hypothetical protein
VSHREKTEPAGSEDVVSWVKRSPAYRRLSEIGVWGWLGCVQRMGPRGRTAEFSPDDPHRVMDELLATGRFCRDSRGGALLHRRAICLRELSTDDSLHVVLYPNRKRLRVHLDRVSPLADSGPEGQRCGYSSPRVIAHLFSRLGEKLAHRLLGGWREIDLKCADVPGEAEEGV